MVTVINIQLSLLTSNSIELLEDIKAIKANSIKLVMRMFKVQQEYAQVFVHLLTSKVAFEKARTHSLIFNKSNSDIDIQMNEIEEQLNRSKVSIQPI